LEPRASLVVGERAVGQELHRHVPVQLLVTGAVDLTHAAGAQRLHDSVVPERPPDHADLPRR
jgi:hypothetical protein